MLLKDVKGVIFDLDGVITDTAEFHYLAWRDLALEIGIEINREFNEKLKGISRISSLIEILKKGNALGKFTTDEIEFLANKKNDAYVLQIGQITPADLLPGIEDLLKLLKQKNYKIAMASASKNALLVSKLLKIEHYFDHIVDAATVVNSKPDPEVFIKAAQAIDLLPEECVGIEDAAAGILAIKGCGMFAVGVGAADILKNADIVVSSTTELAALFL